jgi:hypothetical protein
MLPWSPEEGIQVRSVEIFADLKVMAFKYRSRFEAILVYPERPDL